MRDPVSLQPDVTLEVQQHVKRAGTCWIAVKWCPQIKSGDLDQKGFVTIAPFGQLPGHAFLVTAATYRGSHQVCERAGEAAVVNDRWCIHADRSGSAAATATASRSILF